MEMTLDGRWTVWWAGRLFWSFLALISGLSLPPTALAQRAVIVVIDGARYSETFGAGPTHIPRIWSTLRPMGTIWTNYRNEGVTSTVPGHSSILSGTWQRIANDGSEHPTKPVLFEYFRRWTGKADSAAWVVAGKTKLEVLAYSSDPSYGAPFGARVALADDDSGVCKAALRILKEARPTLMLINFPGVDRAGHAGDWEGYLGALHAVDSLVGEIWTFLRSDSEFVKTLFLVTNDHGRHLDTVKAGFAGHGDGCDGCRHLLLFGAGGGLSRGYVCTSGRSQREIAPSVGEWLGVPTPLAEGVSLLGDTARTTGLGMREGPPQGELKRLRAYPNPFNPPSRIEFPLASGSEVESGLAAPFDLERRQTSEQYYPTGFNFCNFNDIELASEGYFYGTSPAGRTRNPVMAR